MNFSIIIPAKNEEKNIADCLNSIIQIEYPTDEYEIIVVDNGSTDETVGVAKKMGAKVFVQPELTISGLRNFGVTQAQGRVLAFLDADCTVAQDWLSEASRYCDDGSVACFGSPPEVPDDATWVQKTWYAVRKKLKMVEKVEWLESMNMFVPCDKYSTVDGFDEALVTCEDYDLSIRLSKLGDIIADARIVAVHHGEAVNLSHFFRKERWRATSNRDRLFRGDFNLVELPSLLIPPIYCLLALVFVLYLTVFGFVDGERVNTFSLALLFIWQVPLFYLTFRKQRDSFNCVAFLRLYVLLNVYFLARGIAVFRPI